MTVDQNTQRVPRRFTIALLLFFVALATVTVQGRAQGEPGGEPENCIDYNVDSECAYTCTYAEQECVNRDHPVHSGYICAANLTCPVGSCIFTWVRFDCSYSMACPPEGCP